MIPILIIDDDPVIRDGLVKLFTARAIDAKTVPDAETAVAVLKEQEFDLVLTDYHLPGRDGLSVIEYAKSLSKERPVVMISGQGDMDVVVKALRLGVDDFISKPFKPVELVSIVQRELEQYQQKKGFARQAETVIEHYLDVNQINALERALATLRADANAQSTLLIEGNGHVICAKGILRNVDVPSLAALVAGSATANSSISTIIGEEDPFKLSFHEGRKSGLYSAYLGPGLFLVVIFGMEVPSGMVLYQTRRAVEFIHEILGEDYFEKMKQLAGVKRNFPPLPEKINTLNDLLTLDTLEEDLVSVLQEQFNKLWSN